MDLISALLFFQFGTLCELDRRSPYQSTSDAISVLSNYAALMSNCLFMLSTLAGNDIDSHSQQHWLNLYNFLGSFWSTWWVGPEISLSSRDQYQIPFLFCLTENTYSCSQLWQETTPTATFKQRYRQPLPNNIGSNFTIVLVHFWAVGELDRRSPYQTLPYTISVLSNYAALIYICLFMLSTLTGKYIASHSQTALPQAPRLCWFISEQLASWTG